MNIRKHTPEVRQWSIPKKNGGRKRHQKSHNIPRFLISYLPLVSHRLTASSNSNARSQESIWRPELSRESRTKDCGQLQHSRKNFRLDHVVLTEIVHIALK